MAHVVVNGGAGDAGASRSRSRNGARVAATCSATNADYVRALGAERAIDYRKVNVPTAIRDWAPEGVDLAVDTVGQGTLIDVLPAMKRGGVICPIGTLIPDEPHIDTAAAQAAGVTVIPTISTFAHQPRQLRALVDALATGRISAPATIIFPLVEAGEAHRRVQQGHVRGKILLEI